MVDVVKGASQGRMKILEKKGNIPCRLTEECLCK